MQTHLESYLAEKIRREGYISFSDYMEIVLYNNAFGYYTNSKKIFGPKGDFVTAPISSTLFGEAISNEFINLAKNNPNLSILELGGGDGSLALSIISRLKKINILPKRYIILEISEHLITIQKQEIRSKLPDLYDIFEWTNVLDKQKLNGLIIANEFFDSLPTERFRIKNKKIDTLYIGYENNELCYFWKKCSNSFSRELNIAKNNHEKLEYDNYISELNLNYSKWMSLLDGLLTSGVIFIIDYGYHSSEYFLKDRYEGTLVCIHNHSPNFNPLINIGRQDISTFVNFTHIANIAKSLNLLVDGYISQSSFLINLGVLDIFEEKKYSEEQKIIELNRLKNLLLPNTMGEIFKVLVLKKNLNNELLSTKKLNHLHKL
tara:strand:+ start:256 stop:1383 length:1128 start_codon:yes stop_codon:yes gene_type:complete